MNNIIKKLWDYEYNPAEKHIICLEEIKAKNNELSDLEKDFLSTLDKDGKAVFDKIMCKYFDLLDYLLVDAYYKGVKFTGKLFIEIMSNGEK